MSKALIAQILAQREAWVDLEPGKRAKIRRPPESDFYKLRGELSIDTILACTVDWDGFIEADLLPAGVGGGSAVAFDAELWCTVASDRTEWLAPLSSALMGLVMAHVDKKAEAAKNSPAS